MCTALSLKLNNHYFGRTLDLEYNYKEQIIITPKDYPLRFRYNKTINNHYSIFGIGIIENNYPLYYDACNEYGLCIAGLNLPFSTTYNTFNGQKINLTSFEIIPYILGSCINVNDAKDLLNKCNITNDRFNDSFQVSKLHFLISDKNSSIVLEIIDGKTIIYDNPINVLTNEPQFPFHLENINNYGFLSNKINNFDFGNKLNLINKTKGNHLIGLPGDNTSMSRFIKMAFIKENIIINENNIGELFNIFNLVFEINGINLIESYDSDNNKINNYYKTIYSCIYDTNNLIIYFKSFDSSNIKGFRLQNINLDNNKLLHYDLYDNNDVLFIN